MFTGEYNTEFNNKTEYHPLLTAQICITPKYPDLRGIYGGYTGDLDWRECYILHSHRTMYFCAQRFFSPEWEGWVEEPDCPGPVKRRLSVYRKCTQGGGGGEEVKIRWGKGGENFQFLMQTNTTSPGR